MAHIVRVIDRAIATIMSLLLTLFMNCWSPVDVYYHTVAAQHIMFPTCVHSLEETSPTFFKGCSGIFRSFLTYLYQELPFIFRYLDTSRPRDPSSLLLTLTTLAN